MSHHPCHISYISKYYVMVILEECNNTFCHIYQNYSVCNITINICRFTPLQLLIYVDNSKVLGFIGCQRSMITSTVCLMSSCLIIAWLLAGLTFQRYCFIVRKDHFYILTKTKYWIAMLLSFGIISSAYILYERFWNPFPLSFCFITYRITYIECIAPKNCSRYMIIAILVFTATTCSMIVLFATHKLKKYIENHENKTANLLGSRRQTNFDRLKATNLLWIAYSVIYIPWILTRILVQVISNPVIAVTTNDVFHTFGNMSSLIVPLVYIKMDSHFSTFIKTKLWKSNTRVDNTIHVAEYQAR